MENTIIRVSNVSKDFRLPHEKTSSIKNIFTNAMGYVRKRRSYETQHALKDISLEIKQGEFFGIVGRNGSGKSTLLKMLAGIYQPTSGKIETQGKIVPFIELGVGFSPELTGRENVYLNGALLGFSEEEIDKQYKAIVEFAELEQYMDQKLKNYSSGMQVRLAFSMAVRAKADILIIDEVLAVGDADFQRKCFNYFKQLKKQSTTVVFVSHNMGAVREFCDRAMLIDKSKIVSIGSTNEISEKYLQLFVQKSSAHKLFSTTQERWGDRALEFTNIDIKVTPEDIYITQTVKANMSVDSFISGFRIRDSAGIDVTGTNTNVEGQKLPSLNKGGKLVIEWKMPNLLADGTYSIDPSLMYPDGVTAIDWWNNAAELIVKKQRVLPYTVDPGFKVQLSNHPK
jgi:ABC-2 type transport system ATP-binding protein